MKKIVYFALACLIFLPGCLYRMPTERTVSTSPNVNNPALTRAKPADPTKRGQMR